MIIIIDCGIGNLRSIQKAMQKLGFSAEISKDKSAISAAGGLILPGVGAFDAAMQDLRKTTIESVIDQQVALKKPLLGICLGLQQLFHSSEEGDEKGLEILPGTSKRFKFAKPFNLKIPHMGWNRLKIKRPCPILEGIESGTMVYFVHSYYVVPEDETIVSAETDYGIDYASVVCKENIFGVQFHPEKSGDPGLKILKNFGKLCR